MKNKKYFVIGLEPHIERFDFQITYGLSDKTPQGKKRFGINTNEKDYIRCHGDSCLIWSNLFKLLATDEEIAAVTSDNNIETVDNFINQFYITDLCHFAPQGQANGIQLINNWGKIRKKVATHFIPKELEQVQPKVILTQGNGVFKELKRSLKLEETDKYMVPGSTWSIRTACSKDGKYNVLILPHFGSLMNDKTFWRKHINSVRDILKGIPFL